MNFKVLISAILASTIAVLGCETSSDGGAAGSGGTAGGGGEGGGAGAQETVEVAGVTLAARKLDGVPAKELRGMADAIKKQIGSGVVAIVAVTDGKAAVVVGVTDDLTDRLDAVTLVRAGAQALGGKGGGGRPDMAQAGGPDAGAADEALGAIENALKETAAAA